jgi:hypothetical protein
MWNWLYLGQSWYNGLTTERLTTLVAWSLYTGCPGLPWHLYWIRACFARLLCFFINVLLSHAACMLGILFAISPPDYRVVVMTH